MKICFSADWHVSNFGADKHGPITDRGAACLRVIGRMYAHDADLYVGLGDIFDLDRPSPGLISALQDEIIGDTLLLVGNHDQTSEEAGHHALAPLVRHAKIVDDVEILTFGQTQVCLVGFKPDRKSVV